MTLEEQAGGPSPVPEGEVRWGLGDALLGLLVTFLVQLVVGGIVFTAAGWEDIEDAPLWATALLQVPLWAGLLGVPVWVSRRKGRGSLAADFGLRMRPSDIPVGLLAGLVGQFALGIVIRVVYELLGVDTDKVGEAARDLTGSAGDVVGVVLLALIVAIGAPIFEELFYRGLWLRAAERRFGTIGGILLSSFVFAAVHVQPYDFPALFGFGVIAAVLAVRSGRLGPAIWAHVAFNTTALISLLLAAD